MPAFTANLNLYLPGGGSLGIGGDDEEADIDKLNQNFQAIDAWSQTVDDKIVLATAAEAVTGTDPSKLITPATLQGKAATDAEIDAATATNKFVTPAGQKRGSPYLGSASKTTGDSTVNSSTEVAVSGLSLAVTVPRAGRVRLQGSLPSRGTTTGDVLVIRVKEGSTVRGEFTVMANSSPEAPGTTVYHTFSIVLSGVSAAAHTYTIAIVRAAGAGTITVSPTTISPVQLSAEMMD